MNVSKVPIAVLATALVAGALLAVGAGFHAAGAGGARVLTAGAALFFAVPLVRNVALIAVDGRRSMRALAVIGILSLAALYLVAWTQRI